MTLRKTPLFDAHVELNAKIVPFAGYEMPVQYIGLIQEHQAVRNSVGIFDVSHMGEIFIEGDDAECFLDFLTPNYVKKLTDGKAHYSALLNSCGSVIDDIIIYRYSPQKYLLCVNASNKDRDFDWIASQAKNYKVSVSHRSDEFGQIAIQGPASEKVLLKILGSDVSSIKYFEFKEISWKDATVIVARTGYTGEDGFEVFIPERKTREFWSLLLVEGKEYGLLPCGLGARDTLRLESCYPLHGHELSEEFTALESGLGWIVKLDKGDFIGREALLAEKESGSKRKLSGFLAMEPGIIREGSQVFHGETPIGVVTSGTKTPTVNESLGLMMIERHCGALDTELFAEVRGRKIRIKVSKTPFYKSLQPSPK